MLLNVIHRPETGKNYPFYKLQQEYGHKLNLKITLMIPVSSLEDDEMVEEIKQYHRDYGDELALWLWRINKPEWGGNTPFWLASEENKRKSLEYALQLFRTKLGCEPVSIGSYLLDALSMEIVKELSPGTTTVTASCFEEGTKIFHGCNNSWYLFSEGVSWGPWYPGKGHSFRPAANEEDWAGLVAIPHLSRDLVLAYEGRNDFFASHPANVQRGLANKGLSHDYDFNLVDQYQMQEDYNDGYSFYHVHVSPSWLGDNPNLQDMPEVSQQLYLETLGYLAQLRDQGEIRDMYMKEFGDWFRDNIPIGKPNVALGKEILFGSGKHYFWYIDPYFRVLIDSNQGGSIGDIRPYAGRFAAHSGPDSPMREIASYPYIIQSQLRSGAQHHSADDGARTTLFVLNGEEKLDLCYCSTKVAAVERGDEVTKVRLTPASLLFKNGLQVEIETIYEFYPNGIIMIRRKLVRTSDQAAKIGIQEYFKGCYGFTEYAEDLHGIILEVEGDDHKELVYDYNSEWIQVPNGTKASASIPPIQTYISLEPAEGTALSAEAAEGHLFNPYYSLKLHYELSENRKEAVTCLTIRKN